MHLKQIKLAGFKSFVDPTTVAFPSNLCAVVGPNGCGKTTLLRAMVGLFAHDEGEILWRGQSIDTVRHDYLTNILYIGHTAGIKKNLTPRENLHYLTRLASPCSLPDIDQALEQVGLYGYEAVPCYQLSAGQLRRVALARLYLDHSPALWVLDEPYTAIDKQGIAQLESRFQAHAEQGGAVVLTSHQWPSIPTLTSVPLMDYRPAEFYRES